MVSNSASAFQLLRQHIRSDAEVKRELEFAFSSLLTSANPTDRGLRFLFGNGAEWILTAAAWSAGIVTAPQGHNADGFDLSDLMDQARGLWSVKASASKTSSHIRLKNFMGAGASADWTEPTVFVGPYLGGAVFIDPNDASEVKTQVRNAGDALVLGAKVVRDYSLSAPQHHIQFDVKVNTGSASGDPFAFIKSILTPQHFPRLAQPFVAATPKSPNSSVVEQIVKLSTMRQSGDITQTQFEKLVATLTAD